MEPRCAIDIKHYCLRKHGQRVFGDTFLSNRIREENRWIITLSDGLGSGIKANVLSTLTATMAMNFTAGFRDIHRTAEVIMSTLPVCSVRQISYATFTIVEIDREHNVRVINYDNPSPQLIRSGRSVELEKTYSDGVHDGRAYRLEFMNFTLIPHDRIVLVSDGITQAGMGSAAFPLGWGRDAVAGYVCGLIRSTESVCSRELTHRIVNRANEIDGYRMHDDATCGIIHLRPVQELLVVSGPPVEQGRDGELVSAVEAFAGRKVVCGGTTAKIIARELNRTLSFVDGTFSGSQPPLSRIDGIDLVTEGIITLHHVEKILGEETSGDVPEKSPAALIAEMMLDCDTIHFMLGTRINEAWQDPSLPDDIGLRRTIIAGIRKILENRYRKETQLTFW